MLNARPDGVWHILSDLRLTPGELNMLSALSTSSLGTNTSTLDCATESTQPSTWMEKGMDAEAISDTPRSVDFESLVDFDADGGVDVEA